MRFPPPFLFLPAIFGGLFLHRRWPLSLPAHPLLDALAAVGVGAAIALAAPSLLQFRRRRTSPMPFRPASALVTTGAYRFTRNPMYLGYALLTAATAPILDTAWPLLLLPISLWLVQTLVINPEERYLRRRFGAEYDTYTRRVRRWL